MYTSVGWEPPCREQVECALKNTPASFVAYDEEKAIGMVRLIGDGGMSFYIKDFNVCILDGGLFRIIISEDAYYRAVSK